MRNRNFQDLVTRVMGSHHKFRGKERHVLHVGCNFFCNRTTYQTKSCIHVAVLHVEEETQKKVIAPGKINAVKRIFTWRFCAQNNIMSPAVWFEPPEINGSKLIVRIHDKQPGLNR